MTATTSTPLATEARSRVVAPPPSRRRTWRQRRDLLSAVVGAQLRTEFDRHLLGWAWWILEPVMLALTFLVVVTIFVHVTGSRFWLILASVFIWRWFSRSVDQAAHLSHQFAPYLALGSVSLQQLFVTFLVKEAVVFAVALTALCIPLAIFVHLLTINFVPGLILLILAQAAVTYPVAALAYVAGTYSHDMAKLTGVIVGLWFYISPGVYLHSEALHRAPHWAITLLSINPFWTIMDGWQDILVRGSAPPYGTIALWLVIGLAGCGVALTVFRRMRRSLVHRAIEAAR